MVAVLTLFAMLAAVDKNFLTLVVGDLKSDMGLSDVQIGAMIGLAFALSNVAVSLPAGWLADRGNRRVVVALAVAIWSVTAASCSFARSFPQLVLARAGVGVGEGLSPPASYSLIRNGVAPHRRGLAYAVFAFGTPVGSGLAFVIGGFLLAAIHAADLKALPVLGSMHEWQVALVVIGATGLPLAALAFAFSDPGRGEDARTGGATLRQTLAAAAEHRGVLVPLLVFSVLHATITGGFAAWVPALIARTYHEAPRHFGPMLGLVLMIGAPLSLLTAGAALDRLGRFGPGAAAMAAALLLIVAGTLGPHAPSIAAYWPWQGLIIMAAPIYLPVTSSLVARTMPARSVGVTMAVFIMLQGIVGSLGPLVVALLAERSFGGGPGSLNAAITAVALTLGVLALGAASMVAWRSRRIGAPAD